MYLRTSVRMYVRMYVCMYYVLCMYVYMNVCMHVCMYVLCTYVCMYVCMCVYIYMYVCIKYPSCMESNIDIATATYFHGCSVPSNRQHFVSMVTVLKCLRLSWVNEYLRVLK